MNKPTPDELRADIEQLRAAASKQSEMWERYDRDKAGAPADSSAKPFLFFWIAFAIGFVVAFWLIALAHLV